MMSGMSGAVEELPGWEALAPELRERFAAADLPTALLTVDGTAVFLLGPDLAGRDGRMVRFGHGVGLFEGEMCLDLNTGTVHLVRRDLPTFFVNSSLEQFGRSARIVLADEAVLTGSDEEACADAADRIRAAIEGLDPPAEELDTFWDTLHWELAQGTYLDIE
jgi:hypothetical protein